MQVCVINALNDTTARHSFVKRILRAVQGQLNLSRIFSNYALKTANELMMGQ